MLVMRPGARPLAALAAAIARLQPAGGRLETLTRAAADLECDPEALPGLLDALLEPGRLALLLVDRLEEIFGLCRDPSQRQAFATALIAATRRGPVVVTMRADFYGELAALEGLADAVVAHQLYLKPLPAQAVTEAIEAPAAEVGAVFEKGLAAQLRIDAQGSGEVALPFLQHTLELLWRRRRGRWLTWDAYREIGGLAGALRYHASGVLDALAPADAEAARRLLTGLVWLGEGGASVAARPMLKAELIGRCSDPARAEAVLQRLADQRLVVLRDEEDGAVADLAHDTLPLHWGRLRGWIEADRTFLGWRERLRLAESGWRRLGEDPASLLHGSALLEAEGWLAERRAELGTAERRYIELGLAERDRTRRRRERRRRRTLAGVSVALAVALVLAGLLAWQWRLAEEQTRAARAGRLTAEAQMIAEAEPDALERVALLAMESLRTRPARQAYQVLHGALGLMPRRVVGGMGHPLRINRLRFDPGGRYLASASDDDSVGIWDWREGRAVHQLMHEDDVNLAVFSPDGALVASASDDGSAALWDVASGERRHRLAHGADVVDLAFSPGGRLLATASEDGKARLWSVAGGEGLRTFPMDRWVTAVAFSPDGRYLAAASGDVIEVWADNLRRLQGGGAERRDRLAEERPGGVMVWDLEEEREVLRTRQGLGVNAVAFSPDSRLVATAGADRNAQTWDLATGAALASVGHEDIVQQVAFSPDGRYVASVSAPGLALSSAVNSAKAWDPRSGQELARFGFAEPLYDLAVSPTGRTFATGGGDRTARVVEPLRGRELARIAWPGSVLAVAYAPDSRHVAVAGAEGDLSVWEIAEAAAAFGLALNWWSGAVVLDPGGAYLAGKNPADTLQLWPIGAGEPRARLSGGGDIIGTRIASGGRYVATTHYGGLAILWDADRGEPLARASPGDTNPVALPGPQGRRWAVTGRDATELRVLEVGQDAGAVTLRHPARIAAAAFGPGGLSLATAAEDGVVRLWEADRGRERLRIEVGAPAGELGFGPAGRSLAVATPEQVIVYSTDDGHAGARIPSHADALAFSPGGGHLAVATGRRVLLWDLVRGQVLGHIPHAASVYQVAFGDGGRWLITAAGELLGRRHTVQRWLWRPDDLTAEACARLTRNLRQGEWNRYMAGLPYRRTCPELPYDIPDAVEYASSLATEGERHAAGAAYRRAADWAAAAGDPVACNTACWFGALDGYASEVMPACTCGVEGAGESRRPLHRDSRGLARARSGDVAGAIEDFRAFAGALAGVPSMAPAVERRKAWIAVLEAGGDPFDEQTLQQLRGE